MSKGLVNQSYEPTMLIFTAQHPEGVPPSPAALQNIIPSLQGLPDPFAILSGSENTTYMQTLWTPTGYLLEFQEGSLAGHFRTATHDLSAEDVVAAFQSYLNGESGWRTMFEYQRVGVGSRWYHAGYFLGNILGRIVLTLRGR